MYLKQIQVGMMQNFSYLVGDTETRECACVDPAFEVDRLLKEAKRDRYEIKKILLTHNHFDHVEGVKEMVRETGAEVIIHKEEERSLGDKASKITPVMEGSTFRIGKLKGIVLHTPGHTRGSVCYLIEDLYLFTGDTLFQAECGRSDLPESNPRKMFESLQRLKGLDPIIQVYPGHDYGEKPTSTIGYEKEHNPTLHPDYFSGRF